MHWTPDQEKAIVSRNGTVLVSAAAGSGKTAVLVERVIQRLCDKSKPCGIENLLIVTFTNSAAAQMKEKISSALDKIIIENPYDKDIAKKRLMLPYANISTIDSFCINLVRENFHLLGISPDFTILDEGQLKILSQNAVLKVLDEYYESNNEIFQQLNSSVSNSKDDKLLIELICSLYDKSLAYPFPEKWLNSLAESYENINNISECSWGKIIINRTIQAVCNAINQIKTCLNLIQNDAVLLEKYSVTFNDDLHTFEFLLDELSNGNWNQICDALNSVSFERIATISSKMDVDSKIKERCTGIRNLYKASIKSLTEKYFCYEESIYISQILELAPIIRALVNIVIRYGEILTELKNDENGLDFSDTLHYAIKLLTDENCNKTELAKELSNTYQEILIDEYQDVNEAQEMIFKCLSNDEKNLFMVGDVKQSIYSFRQAMPEIFNYKREMYTEFTGENYPCKITLGKNFRSRSGITHIVNFIFNAIMSRDMGDVDYNDKEQLEYGFTYDDNDKPDSEVYLIEGDDPLRSQAIFTADYIETAIMNNVQVKKNDNGDTRPADYGDFCILLRSTKSSAKPFIEELEKRQIPYTTDSESGFLQTPEVTLLISLLKIINNPSDEISLATVMLSPAFGFTTDELSVCRIKHRSLSFYHSVVRSSDENKKIKEFLDEIAYFRRLASSLTSGELVRRIIDEKSLKAIAVSMKDGDVRVSNLNLFIDKANQYESTGKIGLHGFLMYLDKIIKSGKDLSSSSLRTDAARVVKVMTIHKSKGLEFPYCFLVNCEKNYHTDNLNVAVSRNCGIGIKPSKGYKRFDSLPYLAANLENSLQDKSEELRILYVALTRAKEKLIIESGSKDWCKEINKLSSGIESDGFISPYTVSNYNCYSDCLISALIRHKDADNIRNECDISNDIITDCDKKLIIKIIREISDNHLILNQEETPEVDYEMLSEFRSIMRYEYPYKSLNKVKAVTSASDLVSKLNRNEFFASSVPSFKSKINLTPAQRGTATHKFMEHMDFYNVKNNAENEVSRLVNIGILTSEEGKSINIDYIKNFLKNKIFSEILSSDKIYREFSFNSLLPVCDVYPNIDKADSDDKVLIEGVVDCAFINNGRITIIDYKTDSAEDMNELKIRYLPQLNIYKKCLSEVLGLPVEKALIYSFKLNDYIEV